MNTTLISSTGSNGRLPVENRFAPSADRRRTSGRTSPIRFELIADRQGDEGTTCGMILHKFVHRASDLTAALHRAHDSGNARELVRHAQTLASVAANLSAEALCDRAEALERVALQGNFKKAAGALERACKEIEHCVAAANERLQKLLEAESAGTAS